MMRRIDDRELKQMSNPFEQRLDALLLIEEQHPRCANSDQVQCQRTIAIV